MLTRHDRGPVTQLSGWVVACSELDVSALRLEYRQLVEKAPERRNPYVAERNISGRAAISNRDEELLAHDMYECSTVILFDGWQPIHVVDFQTPLNDRHGQGYGKVDLLGAGVGLAVIELKVNRSTSRPDTPLAAILEAVGYAAVVEKNTIRIHKNLKTVGHVTEYGPGAALVLAPDEYWERFEHTSGSVDWRRALVTARQVLVEATDLRIGFASFDSTGDLARIQTEDVLVDWM